MPSQVIVVKRPRRNVFAAPRALPDWLRSFWAALRRTTVDETAAVASEVSTSTSLDAPRFPRLARNASGSHRCVGCDLCVRVCPSRCLSIATGGVGETLQVTRFELVRGACIGCGFCAEACPEHAIEMAATARVEILAISGRPASTDLLSREG